MVKRGEDNSQWWREEEVKTWVDSSRGQKTMATMGAKWAWAWNVKWSGDCVWGVILLSVGSKGWVNRKRRKKLNWCVHKPSTKWQKNILNDFWRSYKLVGDIFSHTKKNSGGSPYFKMSELFLRGRVRVKTKHFSEVFFRVLYVKRRPKAWQWF